MGLNEALLLVTGILSCSFVVLAWKFNRERLYSAIILFLVLISLVGGKTVQFFGFETNTGNIFYASVFLATYFLIERYGKREGIRSIWIGILCVVCFSVLLYISIALQGASSTATLSGALTIAFSSSAWIAMASLIAYAISQVINVYLYIYLKSAFANRHIWLRANACNALAQIADSIIFFTIAFWGVVAPSNIGEIMITGYVIKVVFMMIASTTLYYNEFEEVEESQEAILTFR